MTDAAGLSPDLLEGDARALYDEMLAMGLGPVITEIRYNHGITYRAIDQFPGYMTGPEGQLMVPVEHLWNVLSDEARAEVLKVHFGNTLTPAQIQDVSRKFWHAIKPDGRPRLWRALLSFMRDETATVSGFTLEAP